VLGGWSQTSSHTTPLFIKRLEVVEDKGSEPAREIEET
jgi:hypothetical protein